jgi:hypothetical protein
MLVPAARDAHAQIKAFPQAEGAGAAAVGGRGGDVYHVTNLTDSGAGSLRFGIDNAPSTGRTIVFDVSGWINLNSKLGIVNTKHNITIAGQTAPGGIGVRGNQFSIGGDHVIVRHMRFRPGKGAGRVDSAGANADANFVVYDHVSAGFSYDENFSVAATDLTLQYSTVNYGLEDHSAGSLIEQARRLSMHHNLYAHNHTRNPKARVNETLDWVNNVVYDYDNGFIAGDSDTTDYFWTANFDGNYYITGPGDAGNRMITNGHSQNYGLYFGTNAYDGDGDSVHDGVEYTRSNRDLGNVVSGTYTWHDSGPYSVEDPIWKDANPQAAYERVLSEFGATPWLRDEVDQYVRNNVVNRSGTIISHENTLPGISNGGFGTLAGGVAATDTDRDGMPDHWEFKHGTAINRPSNNGDFDNDGYTNLEEYLNDLAAFKAVGPLEFDGTGRYADWGNWTRRWEPSRADDVHVNVGTATVDAVGQKAGTLRIGTTAAANGTLNISSGWLEVTDEVVIGADPAAAAALNLSGGELSTHKLSKSPGGVFDFTGGTLHADEINFDLVNHGGTLSPGHSIGQTHVAGDLTFAGGALAIELASPSLADTLVVDGDATLGGALDVSLLGGFTPAPGDNWQIISAHGIFGGFSSVTAGYSVRRQGDRLVLLYGVPEPSNWLLGLFGGLTVSAGSSRRTRIRGQ